MDTIIANCAERGPPSCPNRALPSVKKGGLAICLSVEQAATCYKTSRALGREIPGVKESANEVVRHEHGSPTSVVLSMAPEEFRDNARLRYNLKPLDMPELCDG
eukprot:scaffold8483_cov84-Skeletonema_marinoi.AAC.1